MGPSHSRPAPRRLAQITGRTVSPLGARDAVCERHGPYRSDGWLLCGVRECWRPCPACSREAEQREAAEAARQRVEARQRRLERAIQRAAIPPRFADRTFEGYRAMSDAQRRALQAARAYAADFAAHRKAGKGLVFVGSTGTGKSHLACAILRAVVLQGFAGLYITALELIRMVRSTWRHRGDMTEQDAFAELESVDLLVIDEVGMQYGTEGEQVLVGEVLDRRYRLLAPTVVLTNQTPAGLAAYIGDRPFDRLREDSQWIVCDWESYRRRPGVGK